MNKYSYNTLIGADNHQNFTANGGNFPTPLPDFLVGGDITWQIDIWRQLRNARDAAGLRYLGTRDGWNFVLTRLVADVAENYYDLMALDNQMETLNITIALAGTQPRNRQAQEGICPRHRVRCSTFYG